MNGYTQISVKIANQLYQKPANQNESNSSLTNKVHDTHLMLLVFLDLKVHGRNLAVNFLPQYVITLLFSLTCFLTITRRKRPKSGPKTRFQSDFYTLLIICVPPIILGQVLRYLPTVVAIHMNSDVTSYDPCADAIE